MAATGTQEIIRSLGELKSETVSSLATLQAKVDGINRRLDASNGRLAQHEEAIQQLRLHEDRLRMDVGLLQEESEARRTHQRQWRVAVMERLLWLVGAILLAIVVRFAKL